jgi:hypothetical protein
MKNTMKTTTLALLILFGSFAFGQTILTMTTLSSAVTSASATQVNVTSATGITATSTMIYVDAEAISLTTLQASSRIAEGKEAAKEIAAAKYWASEGADRVVHACVHVHGGVGVDRDYPLHRYFMLTRQLLVTLGGPTDQLRRIGAALAS